MRVACLMPTYGRLPAVLAESVESFHRQTYPAADRLLLIANDVPEQEYYSDSPNIHCVNYRDRMTIGQKTNRLSEIARDFGADVLLPWDDDDIFLPHRIEYSVQRLEESGDDWWHTPWAWWLRGEDDMVRAINLHQCNLAVRTDALSAVGGYPEEFTVQVDKIFCYERLGIPKGERAWLPDSELYYIYRWTTTGTWHVSGVDAADAHQIVAARVSADLAAGSIPNGRIELPSAWTRDWEAFAKEVADAQAGA